MSLNLALRDAAKNCAHDGATAVLTLRSGVEVRGRLDPPTGAGLPETVMVHTMTGWATVIVAEIAVVESRGGVPT